MVPWHFVILDGSAGCIISTMPSSETCDFWIDKSITSFWTAALP
jgi:hypothetical protein